MVARLVRDQEVVGSSPVTSTKKTAEILLCGFLLRRNGAHAATWSQHKRAIAQSGPHKKGAAFFMGEEALRRDFVRSEATDRRAKPAPTKGPRGRGFKSRHLNQKIPQSIWLCGIFSIRRGHDPPLGLDTSALTRKEGAPEKRRKSICVRGGASVLTMRRI